MKKQTEQTSRLFYQNLDHKDVFMLDNITHKPTFYGAMAMKDIDDDGRIMVWRKMFRDRYIVCRLNGGGYAGFWGVCYPKEKRLENGGYVGDMILVDEEVFLYHIGQTQTVYLTSEDAKLVKQEQLGGAYVNPIPFFNGVLIPPRYTSSNAQFATFKKNEFSGYNREVDSVSTVGSYSDYATITNSTAPANGSGRCAILRSYADDEIKDGQRVKIAFKLWNAITKSFSIHKIDAENLDGKKGIEYAIIDRPLGANGRNFVLFRTSDVDKDTGKAENWYYTIYEYGPTGIHKVGYAPKVIELYEYSNTALKYNNGIYYLYQTYYSQRGILANRIYTSSDMNSFTGFKPQDIVYLKDYKGNNEIELVMNGPYSGRNAFNCYSIDQWSNAIYEDNKIVKSPSDISWTNNDVTYYFDNLKLMPSGNNFYFFANQMYEAGTQQMFNKYYDLEDNT